MYSVWSGPAVAGFLAVWLLVLTFLVWREYSFLRSLFPKSGERDIRKKFGEVLKSITSFKENLSKLEGRLSDFESESLAHIKKVGLLRFNPYEDTGGDQSFTVAFLDSKGTGVVITSLHARSGTRVFAKPVSEGKADKFKFSKEEEDVVEKAMKQKI